MFFPEIFFHRRQYPVRYDLVISRFTVSDTDPYPGDILGSQSLDDRTHALLSAVAAFLTYAQISDRQIDIVVDHQVTHDQTEAMTLGTRIVVMKDGIVQQIDTPTNLYNRPGNLFVAGFIGSPQMNFLKARLVKEGACYAVELYGIRIPLSAEKCERLAARGVGSREVVLGVRPEHTQLRFEKEEQSIEATLRVNEMMGSELHLHADLEDGTSVILRIPTLDLSENQRADLRYGNRLRFSFPEKVVQLFDPETEESLLF